MFWEMFKTLCNVFILFFFAIFVYNQHKMKRDRKEYLLHKWKEEGWDGTDNRDRQEEG